MTVSMTIRSLVAVAPRPLRVLTPSASPFLPFRDQHEVRVQRYRTNVWHYPGVNSFSRSPTRGNLLELHATVKSVALVADAIMDCTSRREHCSRSISGQWHNGHRSGRYGPRVLRHGGAPCPQINHAPPARSSFILNSWHRSGSWVAYPSSSLRSTPSIRNGGLSDQPLSNLPGFRGNLARVSVDSRDSSTLSIHRSHSRMDLSYMSCP